MYLEKVIHVDSRNLYLTNQDVIISIFSNKKNIILCQYCIVINEKYTISGLEVNVTLMACYMKTNLNIESFVLWSSLCNKIQIEDSFAELCWN